MTQKKNVPAVSAASILPAELLHLVERQYPEMSPGLRAVADYILQNPATFCFLPVQELALRAGVSHATVMRFCKALGYAGYLEFSRNAQQAVQAGLSSVNRYDLTKEYLPCPGEQHSLFATALNMEVKGLVELIENIPYVEVERCVSMMHRADHLFVAGQMASYSLAVHLEQMLSRVTDNVTLVPGWSPQTVGILNRITPQSLVIAIAFPRYPAMTIDFAKSAKEKNCAIVAITNSAYSPLAKLADRVLTVPVAMLSYVDLYAAPIALCNALALEFSNRAPEKTADHLAKFDKTVIKHHLFTK